MSSVEELEEVCFLQHLREKVYRDFHGFAAAGDLYKKYSIREYLRQRIAKILKEKYYPLSPDDVISLDFECLFPGDIRILGDSEWKMIRKAIFDIVIDEGGGLGPHRFEKNYTILHDSIEGWYFRYVGEEQDPLPDIKCPDDDYFIIISS